MAQDRLPVPWDRIVLWRDGRHAPHNLTQHGRHAPHNLTQHGRYALHNCTQPLMGLSGEA